MKAFRLMSSFSSILTFQELCDVFEKISLNKSRKAALMTLTDTFLKCASSESTLKSAIKLATCTIRHSTGATRQQMSVADKTLSQVLMEWFGVNEDVWNIGCGKEGDLAAYAAVLASKNPTLLRNKEELPMSCEEIVDRLDFIYNITGKGAKERKKNVLLKIFRQAQSPRELKYIIRIVQGKLKIGVLPKSIMTAVNSLPNQSTISEQILGKQMLSRDVSFGNSQ